MPTEQEIFDRLEVPNDIRQALRIAKEVGGHAADEAFDTMMRVIDTLPPGMVCLTALMIAIIRLDTAVKASVEAFEEREPRIAAILKRVIEMEVPRG